MTTKTKLKKTPPTNEPVVEASGPSLVPLCVLKSNIICDHDLSRYALGGVKFECRDGVPYAIATDGRGMVVYSWEPQGDQLNAIVSGKMLSVVCNLLGSLPGSPPERAEVSATNVSVRDVAGMSVSAESKAVDGPWLSWTGVIPPPNQDSLTAFVNPANLRTLLDLFIAENAEDSQVYLTITPGDDRLLLTSKTQEVLMQRDWGEETARRPAWIPPPVIEKSESAK